MKHKLKGVVCLFPVSMLLACGAGSPPVDLEAEQQLLLETDRAWSQAAAGDDIDRLVSFWTQDAVIYPAGQPAVVGIAAIRDFVTRNRDIPGFSIAWEPTEAHVASNADMGYTLGVTTISMTGPDGNPVRQVGKYTVVWRKEAGEWKAVVDIFNFDQPSPAASP